jgi:hypothetical protein
LQQEQRLPPGRGRGFNARTRMAVERGKNRQFLMVLAEIIMILNEYRLLLIGAIFAILLI